MIINTCKTFKGRWEVSTVFWLCFACINITEKKVLGSIVYVKQCSLLSLHFARFLKMLLSKFWTFRRPCTTNICMGNHYTTKSCIFKIFLHWLKCTNYSLYDINKCFAKYNWKYHLFAVLGTVIKCPKGTGSAWEIITPQKVVETNLSISRPSKILNLVIFQDFL